MEKPPAKILLVDDDLELSRLIARFLGKNGFEVLTASDAVAAKIILEREPISLLITDLMMPHQDGISFVEDVRKHARYRQLPVILVTAYPADEIMDKGLRKGVAFTLPKPLDLKKLLDLVGFATQ